MKTKRLLFLCAALTCTMFASVACGDDEIEPARTQQQTRLELQKEGEPSHATRTNSGLECE